MSIRNKLDEFLTDIESNEKDVIAFMVLGERVKSLKLEVARSIANAEAAELVDNQEAADRFMKGTRNVVKEYKHFLEQHKIMSEVMGDQHEPSLTISENGSHGS